MCDQLQAWGQCWGSMAGSGTEHLSTPLCSSSWPMPRPCEVRCPAAAGPARRSPRGTLCSAPGVGLQPEQWGTFRAQLPPTPWGKKFCRSSYGTGAHLAQRGHPKRGWCGPVLVRTRGSMAWEHLRDETAPQARRCSPGMSWDVQSCTSCQRMAAGVATGCPTAPVPPSLPPAPPRALFAHTQR